MTKDLQLIETLLIETKGSSINKLAADRESKDYSAYSFQIGNLNIQYRKAKITPKKTGQFVTLWKRNTEKKPTPFTINDPFDFYIIITEQENHSGFFLFPKEILNQKHILQNTHTKGKLGFRVYPPWAKTENRQAEKTKEWQRYYFIDLTINKTKNTERFISLLNGVVILEL